MTSQSLLGRLLDGTDGAAVDGLDAVSKLFRDHSQDLTELQEMPRAYLYVPAGCVITLPLLPWNFRGFSIAVWVQLPPPPPQDVGRKRIRLFKFYSTSKKQGVECVLTPLNDDCSRVSLSMASATNEKGWRHVSSQFSWEAQKWHLLVVTHKQHYLKRSHVECYVNTARVMHEDLSYPTPGGPMSQCVIGGVDPGGATAPFQISGMTMYEDELRPDMMAALQRHGPSHTCLRRLFLGVNPFQNTLVDTRSLSKATTHEKVLSSEISTHLKIIFSFSAHDVIPDDDGKARNSQLPMLCTQWSCEGDRDKKGRWTRLKVLGDHAMSQSAQQTHVVLNPGVLPLALPDRADAWLRHGSVFAVHLLLQSLLRAYPSRAAEAAAAVGHSLSLLQGLLRHSIAHQEAMLHGFGFHVLSHVLRTHGGDNDAVLTVANAAACVALVAANYVELPAPDPAAIPLFVAGVQALLLDFELWGSASFTTQAALLQQLLALLQSLPSLRPIVSTQLVVDLLRRHFAKAVLAKRKAKDQAAVDECVRLLVLLLETSLPGDDVGTLRLLLVGDGALPSPSASLAADTPLASLLVPLSLLRNVRTTVRYLLAWPDAVLSRVVLASLAGLADNASGAVALVAANAVDCALFLLQPKHAPATRLAALQLFIVLHAWMDSADGRAALGSVERHLQVDQVDDTTAALFHELVLDAGSLLGLRHTVAMNDVDPAAAVEKVAARLVLAYDERLEVLREIALRALQEGLLTGVGDGLPALLALPLRAALPFVACLLKYAPGVATAARERVLMEISVAVKTDVAVQKQLLALPWVEWFTDLLASCGALDETAADLIFDTLVTMLCAAMALPRGWASVAHLLGLVRAAPRADGDDTGANPFRAAHVLVWARRLVGLVLTRLVRSRALLSRALAENVHHVVVLAYHLVVGLPAEAPTHLALLVAGVVDVTEMLLDSTHRVHRAGLVPALCLCREALGAPALGPQLPRLVACLEAALQQEVAQRIPIDEHVATHEMLLRVLGSLARGLDTHGAAAPTLAELTLKIATSGEFTLTLAEARVSVDLLGSVPAATAARLVLGTLLPSGANALHPSEAAALALARQTLFPGLVAGEAPMTETDAAQLVGAAARVEEARLLEGLKDVAKKEQERALTEDARLQLRAQWTEDTWKQREATLRSELGRTRDAEYELSRHETPERRRLQLDVYLKSPAQLPAKPAAVISRDDLLQKVGRVIAQQPKPAPVDDEAAVDEAALPVVCDRPARRGTDSDDDEDDDDVAETAGEDEGESGGEDTSRVPLEAVKLPTLEAAKSRHPTGGIGLVPDDRIYLQPACRKVVPEGLVLGTFYVCDHAAVFQPHLPHVRAGADAEWAVGLHRSHRWKLKDVVAVYLRRYRLRESALELFLRDGTTAFLDFHVDGANAALTTSIRNDTARTLLALVPAAAIKQWPGFPVSRLLGRLTRDWQARALSNYDYLMALNTLAGRSFNDLTQYPVLPWVLADYTSETLDLGNPAVFRDLTKPMGALNPERLEEYWERYHSFDDPVIPKFLYGSHYSTAAGVVLYYLVRLEPFASLHQTMQGGDFDLPDRLFNSVADVWSMCNSSMSEVKELTPEWFSTPAFLTNRNGFALGARQDGKAIGDVELPPWAHGDADRFVRLHRAALESDAVSAHLHEWIDLIFGCKQRGDEALAANNVFYYLTYYGLVDLDAIEDPLLRTAMEQQIAHFGQCPRQLFTKGHPPRGPSPAASPTVARPLAVAFRHPIKAAPPSVSRSLGGVTAVRALKLLGDRLLAVNDLGVIELHHWKLHAKPKGDDTAEADHEDWRLATERDLTPFDVVPRLPQYASARRFPVAISEHGRVFASGGSPTGTIHVRLVDLANGHVLAKASVDGHTDVVTCLAMDAFGPDELLLSGAQDCSLLLWQFSHLNTPFRLPRISTCPVMMYRGHDTPLTACHLNVRLGVVVSASATTCLAHNLHSGHVLFRATAVADAIFEQVTSSRHGYVVARLQRSNGSVLAVYSLLGDLVRVLELEPCSGIAVSADGLLVLAYLSAAVRFYRLDDLEVVHEYKTPPELPAAITCGAVGPQEAVMLAVTGHADGSLVWHRLPDADGRVSLLGSVGRFLNLNSRLKVVKGTVQQAQSLAMSTMDNARAVTNTAKDIAGEAKTLMQSLFGGLLKTG
ncbi:BEACH domain-containing protein [Achlya hypogyna]|uniref:BEACH domain-containing protein n=1 Tax=Achlya hypogyna TaxID=1202772 RepID=A0A1V9YYB2_ACHHY|nr:BEACH domain-containing protein [Achlya hypogyna]